MRKLHVMCLGYNEAAMVRDAINLFEKQKGDYPIAFKALYDPGFPSKNPNHQTELVEAALSNGWVYVKIPNKNVAENWKHAISLLGATGDDIVYGCDPDERPQSAGYLDQIMKVFNSSPQAYYVGMVEPGTERVPHFKRAIDGVNILDFHRLVAWPVGAFSVSWMQKINGPLMSYKNYGMIEHATSAACEQYGGKFYMLADIKSEHLQSENEKYNKWKVESAQKITELPFENWLTCLAR